MKIDNFCKMFIFLLTIIFFGEKQVYKSHIFSKILILITLIVHLSFITWASDACAGMDSEDMADMNSNSSIGDDRPVIVFGGIEKTIPNLNDARLMLEIGDSVNGGVRFFLTSYLQVDVGVRVGLPEKLERKLGKRGSIISYTSKDTTAYLGISYISDFKSINSEPE